MQSLGDLMRERDVDVLEARSDEARAVLPDRQRAGGRIGISDVVAEDRLDAAERSERGSYVGCIAGALSVGEYRAGLVA
ncbi:MAG TPA: hypothetical protein VM324_02995, partial [Egibacteraceae bacterium]|nr:hypothetical protein [Egibacteraceae bacterium]